MEVVINGDLVRASDGNGFRAMTVGADGIKEHGRLFEVNNLENVINAAAIWQVASVLVAQKHLADISQKLEDLNKSINRVTEFLEGQRRARIKAIYGYLNQAVQAISNGELSPSVRGQLECCEQDLLEIQIHLKTEFEKKAKRRIEHKERFGTGELEKDISKK